MNVPVTLAGHTAAWRFRGSAGLESWLTSRPWLGGGGLRVVRVGGEESTSAVISALRRSVTALDEGASTVSVRVLDASDLASGVDAAVSSALEVATQANRFEWTRRLLHAQRQSPRVFVISPDGSTSASEWLQGALALVDQLGKTAADSRMTVAFLDSPAQPVRVEADDLSLGLPVDGVFGLADTQEVWRAYLHLRIAWEAGGDVSHAIRWCAQRLRGFATGDDASFERALGSVCGERWSSLEEDIRLKAIAYFDGVAAQGRADAALRATEPQLLARGLLWRPPGESLPRPAPWAARAVLARKLARGTSLPLLRGALVCGPLAHEVLSRCFDFEMRLRAIPMAIAGANPPAEALDLLAKFRTNKDHMARRLYPATHPSPPDEPWSFTTLGQTLHVLMDRGVVDRDIGNRLLWLRNAISHGHYVSWTAVDEVLTLRRRLAA